jgi:hypothetical protein
MGKKLMGIVIVLLLIISFSGVSYADPSYQIGYHYLQYRVYENGKSVDRLCVSLNDGFGVPLPTNQITNVELSLINENHVGSTEVLLSNDAIIEEENKERYTVFFSPSMTWGGFADPWHIISYYSVEVLDGLVPARTYVIKVTDSDGDIHEVLRYFLGEEYLPIVSSQTFKYEFDQDKNFYFNWDISKKWFDIDHLLFNYSGSAPQLRAVLTRYDHDGRVWMLLIKLPYLMGGTFVPGYCDIFDGDYDRIEISVQMRTADNSNRTVSDSMKIKIP